MADFRLEKLADMLVSYSVAVKPGDKVAIVGEISPPRSSTPYIRRYCRRAGILSSCHAPWKLTEMLYRYGSREQIEYIHEPNRVIVEKYDVRIFILGGENSKALSHVESEKMVWHDQAYSGLMKTMMQRTAKGEFRWTIAPYPTASMAQDAEMSLPDYEDFVYKACMPDMNDPVAYWKKVAAEQERIVRWLAEKTRYTSSARKPTCT